MCFYLRRTTRGFKTKIFPFCCLGRVAMAKMLGVILQEIAAKMVGVLPFKNLA